MQITTARQIPLSQITLSSQWNIHPFLNPEPGNELTDSIQSLGLLHPLIVQKKSSGTFHLICGRFRFRALLAHSRPDADVSVLVLQDDCSTKKILTLILSEQLLSAPLSLMEQAFFFNTCLQHFSLEKTAEYFLPLLSRKPQAHIIRKILPLLNLEQAIQKSIHRGIVGDKTAFELLTLSLEDRRTLHDIIRRFELGGGKQKRLVTLSKELAARKQCTISKLLTEDPCSEILTHREMNEPQKLASLFSFLQNSLMPESIQAEKNFQQSVRNMNIPDRFSVSHSDAFEKDEVTLSIRFPELSSLTASIAGIKDIIAKTKTESRA